MSREKIIDVMASGIFNGTFGGTSDPTLADLTAALAHSQAKDALTALEAAGCVVESAAELTRLRAELEEAREALKPFAALHDEIIECCKQYTWPENDPENWVKACQWDHLRAASRFFSKNDETNART